VRRLVPRGESEPAPFRYRGVEVAGERDYDVERERGEPGSVLPPSVGPWIRGPSKSEPAPFRIRGVEVVGERDYAVEREGREPGSVLPPSVGPWIRGPAKS